MLAALVLLAFVLRVWALDRVPPGLDSDEVSIGYNAFSILRTGRDEYGVPLPLAFRAYGEFKRPVYVYLAVPSIAVFGPTPLGVRLPAAALGAVSVAALYLVARLLLRSRNVGLAAAGMLAISPWHLQFTRAAREVSVMLLALLVLAAALLAAFHAAPARRGLLFGGAAAAMLLSAYSYPGGVIVAPLLAAVLMRAYWARARLVPRAWLVAACSLVVLGLAPLGVQFVDGRARARLDQASLLNDGQLLELSERRIARDRQDGAPWILHHAVVLVARRAVDSYLSHFDPTFLFTRGYFEWRHHSSDHGQLYLWDVPLLAAGAVRLGRRWRWPAMQSVGGWLLIGPLAAAFAEHAPHAVRSIAMLPAWYLLAAIGLRPLWRWLRRRGFERDWLLLLALSAGFYVYTYYRYYPIERAQSWASGVLEGYRAAQAAVDAGRFRRVVIPQEMGLTYAYALFATQYDPRRYLVQGGTVIDPDSPFYPAPGPLRFAPFEVRVVQWSVEPPAPDVLYVLEGGSHLPPGARIVQVIKGVSGQDAITLIAFPAGG